jgi:hypothetical protein
MNQRIKNDMQVWLAEVLNDSVEFMKWNEENVLPYDLRITLFAWHNHVDEVSNQCLLVHKSFE